MTSFERHSYSCIFYIFNSNSEMNCSNRKKLKCKKKPKKKRASSRKTRFCSRIIFSINQIIFLRVAHPQAAYSLHATQLDY